MKYIRNFLPIKQGGNISHGINPIYFTKDSNNNEIFSYKTVTSNKINLPVTDLHQLPIKTINDYSFFPIPLSLNYSNLGSGYGVFIFYYYDPETLILTHCRINTISDVQVDLEKDIFFAYELDVFYIPYNNSKVIYHATLVSDSTIEWSVITNCYNTQNGSSSGYTIKESQVYPIGSNLNIFLFFGGICSDSSSYSSCLRIYTWDSSTKQLSFNSISSTDNPKTYQNTGFFYPISRFEIVGLNCYYSGISTYTGFNKIFLMNDSTLSTIPFDFYNKDQSKILYGATNFINGGYFWRGIPKLVSYYYNNTYKYTCYTMDRITYQQTTDVSYINPAIMFGVSDTQFLSIPKINEDDITTLDISTFGENTITKNTLFTTNENSCLIKIPGIPVIYHDPDIKNTEGTANYYFSECNTYPLLLPTDSVVNGSKVTEDIIPYPTSSNVLNVTTRGAQLNKTIYGIQNNRGMNI